MIARLFLGIPVPFDAILAVFGLPIVLATAYDIVGWRQKKPKKRLTKYSIKGGIIAISDAWVALSTENAVNWGVSESGIEAINGGMQLVNNILPEQIVSALPQYFVFLVVVSLVMYFVLYS
ncbi:MAG TPA: hypothetical protein VIH03_03740 [Nitrososphaerales archaeon]